MFRNQDKQFSHGAVATSVPQAAQIGCEVLKQGGNAIDAAVAAAAALTVCEPTSNGIGSDLFAMVWYQGKLYGLDASGPSPKGLSRERLKEYGHDKMPTFGAINAVVPGTPAGWEALTQRFGKRSFEENLAPAAKVALEGVLMTKTLHYYWSRAIKRYQALDDVNAMQSFFDTFGTEAKPIGSKVPLLDHAKTLSTLGKEGSSWFYQGALAGEMVQYLKAHGGVMAHDDLAAYNVRWVEPMKTRFRGYDVYEMPPPTQGLIALQTLGILEHSALPSDPVEQLHQMIEATKIAFKDGFNTLTDPDHTRLNPDTLLEAKNLKKQAALIQDKAMNLDEDAAKAGGTVYLASVDKDGNMVSLIQSNYLGFGSGMVVPGRGVAMNNRALGFSLEQGHVNELKPGKKTLHTIIPAFLMQDHTPLGPFGLMGGFMQPQGHAQVLAHILDRSTPIQKALDEPRWQWMKGLEVNVEPSFDPALMQALKEKGHDVRVQQEIGYFGRGQMLFVNPKTKRIHGATETRCEGTIAGY